MRVAVPLCSLAILLLGACNSKPEPARISDPVPAPKTADSKVMKFSDLPVQVRDALLSKTRGERFAEPRQKWNATDVRDRSLPERRLIFAGTVDGNWFIYYEHGGRGKHE